MTAEASYMGQCRGSFIGIFLLGIRASLSKHACIKYSNVIHLILRAIGTKR